MSFSYDSFATWIEHLIAKNLSRSPNGEISICLIIYIAIHAQGFSVKEFMRFHLADVPFPVWYHQSSILQIGFIYPCTVREIDRLIQPVFFPSFYHCLISSLLHSSSQSSKLLCYYVSTFTRNGQENIKYSHSGLNLKIRNVYAGLLWCMCCKHRTHLGKPSTQSNVPSV